MKRAHVIAVYPDDETLDCGGTLLKLKDMGFEKFFAKADENLDIYIFSTIPKSSIKY